MLGIASDRIALFHSRLNIRRIADAELSAHRQPKGISCCDSHSGTHAAAGGVRCVDRGCPTTRQANRSLTPQHALQHQHGRPPAVRAQTFPLAISFSAASWQHSWFEWIPKRDGVASGTSSGGVDGEAGDGGGCQNTPTTEALPTRGPFVAELQICRSGAWLRSARVCFVDGLLEAIGFVGGVLVAVGLVVILMAWGGMDERMPTQVPPRRVARYPIAAGTLLLVVAAVGLIVPGG